MRAVWYERNGSARAVLERGEMDAPMPGAGEVRVRLRASGVNPSDARKRGGARPQPAYPRTVPHSDGAGTIDRVGDGVSPSRIGERVWVYNAQHERAFGTAAEFVALPEVLAVPLPAAFDFVDGACLGIPAMTAHRCVFADGAVDGATVLVPGGTGRVGYFAVQLAKWGGATVIATVGDDEKAAIARGFGADYVFDRHRVDVADRVMEATGGRGVDRIIEVEFGGNLALDERIIANGGVIAAYASFAVGAPAVEAMLLMTKNVGVRFVLVYTMGEAALRRAADDINAAADAGALGCRIGAKFTLDDVARAHEAVENATAIGNVIVVIDEAG